MTDRHPLVTAAEHFALDESRRKRKRMQPEQTHVLARSIDTIQHQDTGPMGYASRGDLAVGIFGYKDSFPASAATVIADILWAAHLHGHDAADVMREAWSHYYEDVQQALRA